MTPLDVISQAVTEHKPSHVFALFSGGHDSLSSTHVAAQHPSFCGAVHINTGIGIEETREFVRDTCRDQGWPLLEYAAKKGTYERRCKRYGMPGGPQHEYVYHLLKSEQIQRLVRDHKTHWHDRIALVTGVRKQESKRRMKLHPTPIRREGVKVWVNPNLDWSALDVSRYVDAQGLKRNPVVDKLHRSGECLCGALARPEELDEIAFWYPEVARRIRAIEFDCFKRGLPYRWGSEKSVPISDGQPMLPLCSACLTRWEVAA
jgi:3'-phosphoadenosine 5'-phosphosulfate sulfotransferase (PAPS reductase)/FAD synthetase